jgi:hypothetical protein
MLAKELAKILLETPELPVFIYDQTTKSYFYNKPKVVLIDEEEASNSTFICNDEEIKVYAGRFIKL